MRKLILIAALCASCSYDEKKADIFLTVSNIPVDADHLVVVLTPSDTTVTGHGCPSTVISQPNSVCYRPSFQPSSGAQPVMELAFTQPSATGTVKIDVSAQDRNLTVLKSGTTTLTLPAPPPAQMTLQ